MRQLTSIVIKRRKVISKRRKYPVHAIVLLNPAQIRSKNTVQFYYNYLYRREYSYDYKSPTYFCPNILYLYKYKYQISVHHPRCKHHQKIPPCVTPPCCTALDTKIHPYALVRKRPTRNPTIWLSLHFLHAYIINMQTRNPVIWLSLHFLHAYIIYTQTHFVPSFTKTSYIFETWQGHITSR